MTQTITSSNKVLDKFFASNRNIIGEVLGVAIRAIADYPHIFTCCSSNTSRIAPTGIARESATLYSAAILGGDLQSNQAAQIAASTSVMSASCPIDRSKNNSFDAAHSSMLYYADLASLDCIVRDRFSRNASTNSPVGIPNSFANRSSVSNSGICLWLNHTDQLGGSTFVRRFNSLYDSFKNSSLVSARRFRGKLPPESSLGLSLQVCIGFTKFFRYVIVSNNKVALLPRITQTTKHLVVQVLVDNLSLRKGGAVSKIQILYEHYKKRRGRLPSPSFTMPFCADMGGIA